MVKLNMVQVIWNIFRLIEIALAIILVYWTSARLPFAIMISGDYFRRMIALLFSPIFVFLITNVIVFALVSKTSTGQNSAESEYRLYYDDNGFDDLDTNYRLIITREQLDDIDQEDEEEEIVYEDKQVVIMEAKIVEDSISKGEKVVQSKHDQYRRSQSEEKEEKLSKFRRSETMICEKRVISLVDHDELSNEEFQRRIESFIAKQVKFHLQEKSSPINHVTASC